MTEDTGSIDELFEALTIERKLIEPLYPTFTGYSCTPTRWNFYGIHGFHSYSRRHPPSLDIAYYNAEGKFHRIYGPAYVSKRYDIEAWYKDGKLHRLDGPAYTHKNNMIWYVEGVLHRLDGPALIEGGGPKRYWIHGIRYSPKEYKKEIARRKNKGLIK